MVTNGHICRKLKVVMIAVHCTEVHRLTARDIILGRENTK